MTDPLYTFAYSGDASFYRLVPAAVAIVENEEDVRAVLAAARAEALPVTFRAAGTSLSGQAVTDGVLAVLGDGWRRIEIGDGGHRITLGPAVIVARANRALRPHHRRIGPDPASQASCKIGGVVANNSSGMCCGTAQNTYNTMARLRVVLADGTPLDTGDPASRAEFARLRPDLLASLKDLADQVRVDNELVDLIRRKYAIKNTVGYSLNALVDFDDPIDILAHLMVGSEGTLGFVSEITYETVPDHPHKATTLVPFASSHKAAEGVQALHEVGVSAAEFMERKALATVQDKPALAPYLPFLSDTSPAVLVEIMAEDEAHLDAEIDKAVAAMQAVGPLSEIVFTKDPDLQEAMWDVRKGMFASAGAARRKGTAMLTEDVAVPIHRLPDLVDDLRVLLDAHGYEDAIIFGHALAGNLHFQMAENFDEDGATERFGRFNDALADLVSTRFGGSLKAEHGTGRAVAPYVEAEWGARAYEIMGDIKALIEPENLLNPGVILNSDPQVHLKHLKSMVPADERIDLCIECGFCEKVCPSAGMTFTPRQRIAVARERARLRMSGEDDDALFGMERDYVVAALDTCVACNMCSTVCPVGIETGNLVLEERHRRRHGLSQPLSGLLAGNTGLVETATRAAAGVRATAGTVLGDKLAGSLFAAASAISFGALPSGGAALRPGPGAPRPRPRPRDGAAPRGPVVYFPACPSRMFGAPPTALDLLPVTDAMLAVLERAGFAPIVPEKLTGACCGQPFTSEGFPEEAEKLGRRLADKLGHAAPADDTPVVTDASTCALHMRGSHLGSEPLDSAAYLLAEVLPHLTISRRLPSLAVHHNCSAQRLGESRDIDALATACAERIAVLNSVTCCGYAGDKGLYIPRLNAHALRDVKADIPDGCSLGVSTVSTCATGLSEHAGIPFVAIASVLEYVSRPEVG